MKNFGFNLAEVLITLGIIGVVAALTMPALISHHKKLETAARVKKFYSVMSQAIKMSEIDNGPSIQWTKEELAMDEEGKVLSAENAQRALTYFNTYLKDYIKYIKVDDNPEEIRNEDQSASQIKVYLSDGTSFYFNNGACAHFGFDVNGDKMPNEAGKDRFAFLLCDNKFKNFYLGENNNNFGPFCYYGYCGDNRERALSECKRSASSCTVLLMMDGWEFKDDYPYRL